MDSATQLQTQPDDEFIVVKPQEVEDYLAKVSSYPQLPAEFRTRNVRTQFQAAFELIGGIPRLAHWAHEHPTQFYSLYSKLIPAQVTGANGGPMQIQLSWLNERDTRPTAQRSPSQIIDITPQEK